MNKAQLVGQVQKQLGGTTSWNAAERALNAVLKAIEAGLQTSERVELTGWGTFRVSYRDAWRAVDPRTGEPVQAPPYKTVRFSAGKYLKAAVPPRKRARR